MWRVLRIGCLALLVLLNGCLGSFLAEEMDFDAEEARGRTIEIASQDGIVLHAAPLVRQGVDASEVLNHVAAIVAHHERLLETRVRRPIRLYLYPMGSFRDELIPFDGIAFCDEGALDMVWRASGLDDTLEYLLAHELAHLAICARSPGNGRMFVVEGLAEYLAQRFAGPPPQRQLHAWCERQWPLATLASNAGWLSNDHLDRYAIAELFTRAAVDQVGLRGYLAQLFGRAMDGTTADLERALIDVLGVGYPQMARRIRRMLFDEALVTPAAIGSAHPAAICAGPVGVASEGVCSSGCRCEMVPHSWDDLGTERFEINACVPEEE